MGYDVLAHSSQSEVQIFSTGGAIHQMSSLQKSSARGGGLRWAESVNEHVCICDKENLIIKDFALFIQKQSYLLNILTNQE